MDVLGESPPGFAVDAKENRGLLYESESESPVVWVSRTSRGPGHYVIWPHWRRETFIRMVRDTLELAERANARLGGTLDWLNQPWTPEKRGALLDRPTGMLGVEWFELVTEGQEPRPREPIEALGAKPSPAS